MPESHVRICSLVRWLSVVSIFLTAVCFTGCRDTPERGLEELRAAAPPFVPRTHLPGTFLRDHYGRYWMVMAWPERAPIAPGEVLRAHLDRDAAVPMASIEELCLRDRGQPWHGREGWELVRLPDAHYWYVDRPRQLRREATMSVIRSWNDDPSAAAAWNGTADELDLRYRDLGPMDLADGTLIRSGGTLYYFMAGKAYPFASEELARAAGYPLAKAVEMPPSELWLHGEVGLPLTADVFLTCPMAAANARRDDDADGDGANRAIDCDDHNPARAPHLMETCDGVDNNCDGVADEGFPVGLPCTLNDGCQSPGNTSCAPDHWGVSCQNEDALCP